MAVWEVRWPTSLTAVQSILPQVDRLYLTLNGFTEVPEELVHPKIVAQLEPTNIGDIGKFADVPLEADFDVYLSLDDDIHYPHGYALNMTAHLHRKWDVVIAHHGTQLNNLEGTFVTIKNNNPRVRCTDLNTSLMPLDLPGTGVCAYPSELYRRMKAGMMTGKNCADMLVGRWCRDESVMILGLPHKRDWIKVVDHGSQTIWDQSTSGPELQKTTKLFREIWMEDQL